MISILGILAPLVSSVVLAWAVWAAFMRRQVHSSEASTSVIGLSDPPTKAIAAAVTTEANLELIFAQPEVVPSAEQIAKLKWKRKLRVVLVSKEKTDIDVCAPDWISRRGFVPFQPPFWSIVRLENRDAGGWRQDQWKNDGSRVTVPPGYAVQVSVGLNDSLTVDEIKERLKTVSVGTLVVPVYINGVDREWRKDI